MAYPDVPHLKWPLELLPDGSLAVVEQDTIEDVQQCVFVLRETPIGSRPLAPKVGTIDPTFVGADPADVEASLTDPVYGEPRALVTVTVDGPGPEQTVDVQVALSEIQEG